MGKIRNIIVELLLQVWEKNYYFSKRCFPWICCMLQVGLISFITCFCALRLSLAVSNSLANKIRWRLSARRKKTSCKISYLQEIKSSRDILTTSVVPNYTGTGLSPTLLVLIHLKSRASQTSVAPIFTGSGKNIGNFRCTCLGFHTFLSTSLVLVLTKSVLHQHFGCWSGLH